MSTSEPNLHPLRPQVIPRYVEVGGMTPFSSGLQTGPLISIHVTWEIRQILGHHSRLSWSQKSLVLVIGQL
jgi:hypothetical protein